MNEYRTIIDVKPIDYSSTRLRRDAYTHAGVKSEPQYRHRAQDSKTAPRGGASAVTLPVSALGGLMQIGLGISLIAIGIPMLVLPGPGLISIAAGGFLISRGIGNMRS